MDFTKEELDIITQSVRYYTAYMLRSAEKEGLVILEKLKIMKSIIDVNEQFAEDLNRAMNNTDDA